MNQQMIAVTMWAYFLSNELIKMALAIFDLDNTLLHGDSDYEWGQFLVAKKLVDEKKYEEANKVFYENYKNGTLDIFKYSSFSFQPLSIRTMEELKILHDEYLTTVVKPMINKKSRQLIKKHKQQGDTLIVITATNSFITRPIATELGIENLLATDPLIVDGRYTTEVDGTPCFQEGKITRLNKWLEENNQSMKGSTFYSDSYNDISLLEAVDTPIAVDPDDKLREVATSRGWEIISLRN
jgi:HAD superfamily hydrolase (TIGR01490 family)